MGVQGLWEILQPTAESRSLAHLAVVDGFESNSSERRAFRIGIDASLWYQHASGWVRYAKRDIGANPDRPKVKRGSKKGKSGSHNLTQKMKEMLNVFGMEWRMALGEAEAELAHLNRVGVIDAIMTDDADAFLFGARAIIRNPSLSLTGNRNDPAVNMEGKASQHHVKIFTADAIRNHPAVRLTRGGMILIALLSGGDYDHGIQNCGPQIAHGLALCGFGDQLLAAYECGAGHFKAFLPQWRAEVNQELRTNSQGKFETRHAGISIPGTFPDPAVMEAYANPVCSGRSDQYGGVGMRDKGDLSLSQAAAFCEAHFDEWGHRSAIVKRFRDLLWDSAVMNVLRRAALEADEMEKSKRVARGERDIRIRGPLAPSPDDAVGTPASLVSKYLNPATVDPYADIFVNRGTQPVALTSVTDPYPLLKEIVGSRTHVSTDRMLEYRVVVNPRQLVDLVYKGIKGKHPDPPLANSQGPLDAEGSSPRRTPKKPPPDPYSDMRLWVPASMMRQVHPGLVEAYEEAQRDKEARKASGGSGRGRGRRRQTTPLDSDDDNEAQSSPTRSQPTRTRRRTVSSPDARVAIRSPAPGPFTPNLPKSPDPPSRAFHNVGLIDNELPPSGRHFLFTYTNPDDPDMAVWGDDSNAPDTPGLTITNSNIPEIPKTLSGTSRKGKGREKPTPATIPSVEDDNDEWELPQLRPSQLDQYDDMFDRILGIAPSKRKAKANTSRSTNVTATRKRARAQAAANADSQADSAQGAKKRKTTQPKPSTSSSSVAPRTSQPLTRLTHDAGHNSHRRQPAPFPGLSSSNHLDTPSLSHAIPKPRPVAARQAPLTAYPSSSQDSVSGGFLADVVIFKDLTSRKR